MSCICELLKEVVFSVQGLGFRLSFTFFHFLLEDGLLIFLGLFGQFCSSYLEFSQIKAELFKGRLPFGVSGEITTICLQPSKAEEPKNTHRGVSTPGKERSYTSFFFAFPYSLEGRKLKWRESNCILILQLRMLRKAP